MAEVTVAILIVIDYLLTYVGITWGVITEANPLMVWMFTIPFWAGFALRVTFAVILCGMLHAGRKARLYRIAMLSAFALQAVVMTAHIYWIAQV